MNPVDNTSSLVNNVQQEQNHPFYQLARPYSPGSERSISSYNTPDINSHYSSEEGYYRAYQASRRRSNTLPDMYISTTEYCMYSIPTRQSSHPLSPLSIQPPPQLQQQQQQSLSITHNPLQNQLYYPPLPQVSEFVDQPSTYWLNQRFLSLDITHDSNIRLLEELLLPYQAKLSYKLNNINGKYHVIVQFKDVNSIESAYYNLQNRVLNENEIIDFSVSGSNTSSSSSTPNPSMILSPTQNNSRLHALTTNSSFSRGISIELSDCSVCSNSSNTRSSRSYSDTHLLNAEAEEFHPHFLQPQIPSSQYNPNPIRYSGSEKHLLSSSSNSVSSIEIAQALSVMSQRQQLQHQQQQQLQQQPSHLQINTIGNEMYSEFYPSSTTPHSVITPSSPQSQQLPPPSSLSVMVMPQSSPLSVENNDMHYYQQQPQQLHQQQQQLLNQCDYTSCEWTYLNSPAYIDTNNHFNYNVVGGVASPAICSRRNSNDQIQMIQPSLPQPTIQQQQQQQVFGSITASGRVRASHYESDTSCYNLDINKVSCGEDKRTTLMIRNIPNKYNQTMLLNEINIKFLGSYDFFYLPIDFKNSCNVGYAFINFINPMTIIEFYNEFNNRKWNKFNSEKICDIKYGRIQGKEGLINHFRKSAVITVDEVYRPLLFKSSGPHVGEYEPFPIDCYNSVLK